MPIVFTFKCSQGHQMEVEFPFDTKIDDEDETTCSQCLAEGDVKPAYVVAVKAKVAGVRNERNERICG